MDHLLNDFNAAAPIAEAASFKSYLSFAISITESIMPIVFAGFPNIKQGCRSFSNVPDVMASSFHPLLMLSFTKSSL